MPRRKPIWLAALAAVARPSAAPAADDPVPAPAVTVATRATRAQDSRPPQPIFLVAGDGHACARVVSRENGEEWRCWTTLSAPPRAGAPVAVVARRIGWLESIATDFGPTEVCTAGGKGQLRCWSWPAFLAGRPGDLPPPPDYTTARPAVGGSFHCWRPTSPQKTNGQRWTCDGDDRFGQLGKGKADRPSTVDNPDAGTIVGAEPAVGTWHGCIKTADATLCWGRGDAGQLGAAPPDRCGAGAAAVACSRAPRPVSFPIKGFLYAGDLYTCAADDDGLHCWGGSRDGAFGTAAACPANFRHAWPTLLGTAPAPAATCAPTPVVPPGFKHAHYEVAVGPRGLCAVVQGHVHCAGAIPTPDVNVRAPVVNKGDEPTACGIADSDVVCWGGRYSPGDDPSAPTTIKLAETTPAGVPIIDAPPPHAGVWGDNCAVHFGCARTIEPLPACAKGTRGQSWAALGDNPARSLNNVLSIRGELQVGPSRGDVERGGACTPHSCCLFDRRALLLQVGGGQSLALDGLDCRGDESRLCCNAPVFGQTVVATGRLTGATAGWSLRDVKLCAPR